MAKVLNLQRRAPEPELREHGPTRLTKRIVEAIEPDPYRDVQRRDTGLKGFGVRVQPTGIRTYFVQYRDQGGRTRRLALGRHGPLSAEAARKLAMEQLGRIARGEDPSAIRKAERAKARRTQTVAQLVERFMREYVEPKRKRRTVESYRRLLDARVLPELGSRAVEAVVREDIEALHFRLRKTPYEANRTLAVLSKMFNMAEAWRLRPLQSNPCYRVERYPERRRDRFFGDEELKRIGAAIAGAERNRTLDDGAVLALRLLALTGCRASEVLNLRWSHVDLESGVLRLADAKAGARAVPLGRPAIALLEQVRRRGDRVVRGRGADGSLTLSGLEKAWSKVRIAAKLGDARLHDLRHTVGTFAGQAGLNAFMVRDILGHKTLAMTGRYVSQDTTPLRRAADEVSGRVAEALAGHRTADLGKRPRKSRVCAAKRR